VPPEDELGGAGEGAGVSTVGVAAREPDSLDGAAAADSLGAATEGVTAVPLVPPLERGRGAGGGGAGTAPSGATLARRAGSAALTFATGRMGAASARETVPARNT
jgi:hypothetical protein